MTTPATTKAARSALLRNRIAHAEAILGARLAADAFDARLADIAAGRRPSPAALAAAYLDAYRDALMDEEGIALVLGEFAAEARDRPDLGLQDFLEEYLNPDGDRPRLEVVAAPARPAKSRSRPRAADADAPPAPLPGQAELPFVTPPAAAEAEAEAAPDNGAAEAEAAAEAAAAATTSGKRSRPWPAGSRVRCRFGKDWSTGRVVEDLGDERLSVAVDGRPDDPPRVIAKSRCKRIKDEDPASATAPAADAAVDSARVVTLEVTEADSVAAAAWLASAVDPSAPDGQELATFAAPLDDGGLVVVSVVNGTPAAGRRPYVRTWVFGPDERIASEPPPASHLVGRHAIALAGLPATLEVVVAAP